jgi:hypothetical protein
VKGQLNLTPSSPGYVIVGRGRGVYPVRSSAARGWAGRLDSILEAVVTPEQFFSTDQK